MLSQQVADAKEQLGEISLSEAAYSELIAKPLHLRSLADEVRLVTYEGLSKLKQENAQLRSSSQVRLNTPGLDVRMHPANLYQIHRQHAWRNSRLEQASMESCTDHQAK